MLALARGGIATVKDNMGTLLCMTVGCAAQNWHASTLYSAIVGSRAHPLRYRRYDWTRNPLQSRHWSTAALNNQGTHAWPRCRGASSHARGWCGSPCCPPSTLHTRRSSDWGCSSMPGKQGRAGSQPTAGGDSPALEVWNAEHASYIAHRTSVIFAGV